VYIAWLAVHTFMSARKAEPADRAALGFANGILLQLLNAKVIIYGLTLYYVFLESLSGNAVILAVSAAAFALIGFAAISLWSALGSTLTRVLANPRARKISSLVMSALLLYSALESSGLLSLLLGRRG
jgi:cysteine/O-acetylserine efflux protein